MSHLDLACDLPELCEPVFVARQPIFDRHEHIWGYELLFRHSDTATTAHVSDQNLATSKVIADGLALALTGLQQDTRVLINFPSRLILQDTALALPKERCVVEILEHVKPEPEILKALKHLKTLGYTLALDDFVGDPGFEPLIELSDIIKIEVLGMTPLQIAKLARSLARPGLKLLAEKVETREVFEQTRTLGFDYFQGYFFSKPEIVPGRKIKPSTLAKVQLLQQLSNPEVEFEQLADIISKDVSLSYRLLKFINSSAFSLRSTVQSISQAITLLGLAPFKQWAMVVLMSDMDSTAKGKELAHICLQRARFLESLSKSLDISAYPPDAFFLLGLLSKLDALLGQPMDDVLQDMPLDPDIAEALKGKPSPARNWLDLARVVEQGRWDRMVEIMQTHDLPAQECAVTHAEAGAWAHGILGMTEMPD